MTGLAVKVNAIGRELAAVALSVRHSLAAGLRGLTRCSASIAIRPVQSVLVALALCLAALPAASAAATSQTSYAPSNVVLVFDFSNSILASSTEANVEFAQALDDIADRAADVATDLANGNAGVSFIVFGGKAILLKNCEYLALHDDLKAVERFEGCLRELATDYRAGPHSTIAGDVVSADTDHVAALRLAAQLLPTGSLRPAVVFFTDGDNDPAGTKNDNEDVVQLIKDAYDAFDPLVILPVGLGAGATSFEGELAAIYDAYARHMDPCAGRAAFKWPQVVFSSPDAAGKAVALALQEVTCSFPLVPTPSPTPAPSPSPSPVPATPGVPTDVQAVPTTGGLDVTWQPPLDTGTGPLTSYSVRCRRTDGGAWVSTSTRALIRAETDLTGLDAGYPYECTVAAANAIGQGGWSAPSPPAVPRGLPPIPGKPLVEAGNGQAAVSVPEAAAQSALIRDYSYECADGQGGSAVVQQSKERSTAVTGLTNSVQYTCVAYSQNEIGRSAASPASDPFTPCGSLFECNPMLQWVALAIGVLAALLTLLLLLMWLTHSGIFKKWVTAALGDGSPENLGWGPRIGARIESEQDGPIVKPDRRPDAPIQIADRGGDRFYVTSTGAARTVRSGQPTTVVDADGASHELVLRKYSRKPARHASEPEETDWSSPNSAAAATGSEEEYAW
jgi:hypothetical protein